MIPRKTAAWPYFEFAKTVVDLAQPEQSEIGSDKKPTDHGFTISPVVLGKGDKGCGVIVTTPQKAPFKILTTSYSGGLPNDDLCSVNDTVRSIIVNELASGQTKKLELGPKSLHSQNPCDLMQPVAQSKWPQATLKPKTWSCTAVNEGTGESAEVQFEIDKALRTTTPGATQVTIGGRPAIRTSLITSGAFSTPGGTPPPGLPRDCILDVQYGPFTGGLGANIEVLRILALAKTGDPNAVCQTATSMAESVLQRLG